jgi:hypothetical protein
MYAFKINILIALQAQCLPPTLGFLLKNKERVMSKQRKIIRESGKIKHSPFKDYWTKQNLYILILGLFGLMIGYFLMSKGPWDNPLALSISPIVLLIVYLILIPISIFYKQKKKIQ